MKKLLTILILVPIILYMTACQRENTNPHTGYITEQCGGWTTSDKNGRTTRHYCDTYIHTEEMGVGGVITLSKILMEKPERHNHYVYYIRG